MPMKRIMLVSFLAVSVPSLSEELKLGAAPFETYISDEGEPSRLTNLIDDAFSRMQTGVELAVMRDAFLGSAIRSGRIDGEFAYVDLGERKDNIILSKPYLPLYLYATAKHHLVEEIKLVPHLKDERVAIENRFANTPKLRMMKEVKWSRNPTTFDAFKQLADDRAPYLVTSRLLIEAFNVLLSNDKEELLHYSSAPLITAGFSLALLASTPNAKAIIQRFELAVDEMQNDGSYNTLLGQPWLTKDINNDGSADYIGSSQITTQLDSPERSYPLDNSLPSTMSIYIIDGKNFSNKNDALAQLKSSPIIQDSVLDPDVYRTMIRRW